MVVVTIERRAQGLAAAARVRRAELLVLAERLAGAAEVAVDEAPAPAAVMVELEAPMGSFCLAQVVVTTAGVRLDGQPGWGCVVGWDDEGALAVAMCSATGGQEVDSLAGQALLDEEANRASVGRSAAATRVELS